MWYNTPKSALITLLIATPIAWIMYEYVFPFLRSIPSPPLVIAIPLLFVVFWLLGKIPDED